MSNSVWSHRRQSPGSPVAGILQAGTLEWVAISFSNAWKWKVKVKSLSCVRLLVTPWTAAYQAPPSMEFSRQEYWSGLPLLTCKSQWSSEKRLVRPWVLSAWGKSFFFLAEEISVNAWIYKDHAYSKKGGKFGALGPQRWFWRRWFDPDDLYSKRCVLQ